MSDQEMSSDSHKMPEEDSSSQEEYEEKILAIDPKDFTFSENIILNLHDLVGILLHEFRQMDTVFRYSKLLEVADGKELVLASFRAQGRAENELYLP